MPEQLTDPTEQQRVPLQLPHAVLGVPDAEAEHHYAETPDFKRHISALEKLAATGTETPRGVESYAFRTGIEVEFSVGDPVRVRKYLGGEGISDHRRGSVLRRIKNPDMLEGQVNDDEAVLAPYREQARAMIKSLPAANEAEEARRQEWLGQIDSLTVRDLFNFRLYSEFSKPTLGDVTPPSGTMQELDDYTARQGWLEFRFGHGTLQTGYYDNEGISEIRIAPASPNEALRRQAIVMKRAAELASEYGLLLCEDPSGVHINTSVYMADEQGDMRPIIGQDEARQERTVDATSGVAAAYEDGLFLHAQDMPHDFMFGPHANQEMGIGPTRKSVRIREGMLELRARFQDPEQGLHALMAGMVYGLQHGHEALQAAGHTVTKVVDTYKVSRSGAFDKEYDLQIQRAFENSEPMPDGSFELNSGWNMLRGGELMTQLIGEVGDLYGADSFNDMVMAAVRLDAEGTPYVSSQALARAAASLSDFSKEAVMKYIPNGDVDALAQLLSQRLGVVRLQKVAAIKGNAKFTSADRQNGINKVAESPIAALAYQGGNKAVADWLRDGESTYAYLRLPDL